MHNEVALSKQTWALSFERFALSFRLVLESRAAPRRHSADSELHSLNFRLLRAPDEVKTFLANDQTGTMKDSEFRRNLWTPKLTGVQYACKRYSFLVGHNGLFWCNGLFKLEVPLDY